MSQKDFRVGFTGTRKGMTDAQKSVVFNLLVSLAPTTYVHGACRGGDVDFNDVVVRSIKAIKEQDNRWCAFLCVHMFPACGVREEDQCLNVCESTLKKNGVSFRTFPEDKPLVRNKSMVNQSDIYISCPGEMKEVLRSGTWATTRHAKKKGNVIIVYPDGSTEKHLDGYIKKTGKNRAVRRYEAAVLDKWMD